MKLWNREPAVIIGLVAAAIALAVGFGLAVTAEQVSLIMAFVIAGLSFLTRSQVTPTSAVAAEVVEGQVVTGAAVPPAGEPAEVWKTSDTSSTTPIYDELSGERGAIETSSLLVALACIVIIAVGLVWLVRAF